jgi:formate dehydrogenase accessory protein FdhD
MMSNPDSTAPEGPGGSQPLEVVAARRLEGDGATNLSEALATEVPVALQFNGRSQAVMLATPLDLEDFATGFAVTEGIVRRADEVSIVGLACTANGVVIDMRIPDVRFALLETRERSMAGRTGCGLCGTSTLEAAIRPVRAVDPGIRCADLRSLLEGLQRLTSAQPLNEATGAVHAAALMTAAGAFVVREDVGRHNAIDKAVGAVLRSGDAPHTLLVTSRASYEVVHKAAEVGCRLVAAISAPTALAVELAREAGITLVAWARPPRLTVYSGTLA